MELCVRPGRIISSRKPPAKEDSERCTVCLDYKVPEDNPLVICELCEIFGHRVGVGALARGRAVTFAHLQGQLTSRRVLL